MNGQCVCVWGEMRSQEWFPPLSFWRIPLKRTRGLCSDVNKCRAATAHPISRHCRIITLNGPYKFFTVSFAVLFIWSSAATVATTTFSRARDMKLMSSVVRIWLPAVKVAFATSADTFRIESSSDELSTTYNKIKSTLRDDRSTINRGHLL